MCNGVLAKRIAGGFNGERRAARQSNAGMIAGAGRFIHTEPGSHHAPALLELGGCYRLFAALTRQHALAVGNHDPKSLAASQDRALERIDDFADAVGGDIFNPFNADAAQRFLQVHLAGLVARIRARRRDVLMSCRRRISILENDKDTFVFVEDMIGDACRQPLMPESAIAHDADDRIFHHRRKTGRRCKSETVAENGIADLEGFQRCEAVTADIGAHMHFADLFLNKLDRSEHRTLRAAAPGLARQEFRAPSFDYPESFSAIEWPRRRRFLSVLPW